VSARGRRPGQRRLLCIFQHAPTRDAPGLYRHRLYFAELVRRGWIVDVVSTPVDYMTGEIPASYRRRLLRHEVLEGIDHHWVWAPGGIHRSRRRRAFNYAAFAVTSWLRALTLPRPDVVWLSSPPLPLALVGETVARRFRTPWIYEIRDLWPESTASVGWLAPGSWIYRLLERIARRAATTADAVVVPTPGLETGARAHGAPHVDVLPGIVTDSAGAAAERPRVRETLAVGDDVCLFSYVGAIGVANGLDILLDAATLVRAEPRIMFLLVGDGSDRERLSRRIEQERLTNVRLLGAVPKGDVPELLAASDVCLHVLRDDPIFRAAQPTKMLEYFGAHRPFITTVDGLPRRHAEASGGAYAPTAETLAAEVRRWAALTADERAAKGEQAFAYGASRFALSTTVDRLERLLMSIIAGPAAHDS
jgi:glycosyltransferase involved in cell wall biosynthesis